METSKRATEFVIFCIENTAARLGITGAELFKELNRTNGIRNFLYPSYNALHTQGKEYIVDETIAYMQRHNPSLAFLKQYQQ